jgi:hypothetical protein
MMQTKKYLAAPFSIGGLSALLLAGCATSLGDNINIPVGELAMYEATPKEKSIAHLEKNILEAKKQDMPFLAPHYFREASDIFNRAVSSSDKVPTAQLAKADVLIDKGQAVSEIVKKTFARELELKVRLDALAANEIYPWEYKRIIYQLSQLMEKVEMERIGNIDQDKEALNKNMQGLYSRVLQYTSLHESHINSDP